MKHSRMPTPVAIAERLNTLAVKENLACLGAQITAGDQATAGAPGSS